MGYGWHSPETERHGTLEAWRRHQQNGGPPCEPCKTAHALHLELRQQARIDQLFRELIGTLAQLFEDAGPLPP